MDDASFGRPFIRSRGDSAIIGWFALDALFARRPLWRLVSRFRPIRFLRYSNITQVRLVTRETCVHKPQSHRLSAGVISEAQKQFFVELEMATQVFDRVQVYHMFARLRRCLTQ